MSLLFDLFSTDEDSDKIYRHDGFSSTILDSFSSPSTGPFGLAQDGINLYSCDQGSDKIYKHDGFSSTILDYFSSPSTGLRGLACDGTNFYSSDSSSDKIYKHDGFSSTILDSFSSPSTYPGDLACDGINLYSCDEDSDKIYKHDGFSSTILDYFSSPSHKPHGLTWDGTNLYSSDAYSSALSIYKHDGFSSTILDHFSSPSTAPTGLTLLFISPPSSGPTILSAKLSSCCRCVKLVFSEDVWSDLAHSVTISKDDLNLFFSQNADKGGVLTGVTIDDLYTSDAMDALLSDMPAGTGYSTIYIKLILTGRPPIGVEIIEIKPASGNAIYDSSGLPVPVTESSGKLTLGVGGVLDWTAMDKTISRLNNDLEVLLPSLAFHGLHVFYSDKALFSESLTRIRKQIPLLPLKDRAPTTKLANFFERYYGR